VEPPAPPSEEVAVVEPAEARIEETPAPAPVEEAPAVAAQVDDAPTSTPISTPAQVVESETGETTTEPVVTFVLHDDAGAPLRDASIVARWRDGGVQCEALATPTDSGAFRFDGPIGPQVVFEARAPGHAPTLAGPLDVENLPGATLGLGLESGATVAGRVRSDSKPCSFFRVIAWPTGNQGLAAAFSFERADEGEFSIDGAWSGPLTFLAIASDGSSSAPFEWNGDAEAEIELVVEAPIAVKGRVVGVDGRPVAGARVEALAASDGFGVATLTSAKTDSKGRFTLRKASASGLVAVYADGLAPHVAACAPNEAGDYDLGDVELETRRTIRAKLVGHDGAAHEWSLTGWGVETLPNFEFDGAGEALLTDLAPGRYSCTLRGPDDQTHYFEYTLSPESDDVLEIRLR